jgi:hypothetical protein
MDNQAKGLVPTTQPHRDQVIEQIKANFTFSIEQAIETAGAASRHSACMLRRRLFCAYP